MEIDSCIKKIKSAIEDVTGKFINVYKRNIINGGSEVVRANGIESEILGIKVSTESLGF